MEIKFNSDVNLPLNKILKLHNLTIIVRSVFTQDGKSYPQIYLDELKKCCNMKRLMFPKKLTLTNQINQKNVWFVINGNLKKLFIVLIHMYVINVMIY